jgi:putative FmdB family regulatory protein
VPIYEFQCEECGSPFEDLVSSAIAAPQVECPECGSRLVKKRISLFGMSGGRKNSPASFSACTTST